MDYQSIQLGSEKLKTQIVRRSRLGSAMLAQAEFSAEQLDDEMVSARDELLYKLETYVFSQRLVEESHDVYWTTPATWWDHFKGDRVRSTRRVCGSAWRWFVKRHPVHTTKRTQTVVFEAKALFPYASIVIQDQQLGRPVIFESYTAKRIGDIL